jgi:hypothetical protein
MTRATKRNLIMTAVLAAGSLAAIPTGWAVNSINVDTNPGTSTPTFRSARNTSGTRWVDFSAGVGVVPFTGGRQGAWADAFGTNPSNLQHRLTLLYQCTTGGLQQLGPVTFTGSFFPLVDLSGVCSGTSTPLGAIVTDNIL